MAELKPPAGMSKGAATHFARLVKEVEHRWEAYHADALAMYCEAWQLMLTLQGELGKGQLVIVRTDGQQQVSPVVKSLKETMKLIREMGTELGLSPVSEARNKLEKPEEVEEEDRYAKFRDPKGF